MSTSGRAPACRSCRADLSAAPVLDMGALPITNRFASPSRDPDRFPLRMTACPACGLVQLVDEAPAEAIVPRVGWIRYNEPEGHLDDVVEQVCGLLGRVPSSAVGLGPFEGPLLSRFAARGAATQAPALQGPAEPGRFPYLESWIGTIEAGRFEPGEGGSDLVTCRYLLEHAADPGRALRALSRLARPDGLVLVEVPDSESFLRRGDYAFPWEEHCSYFVEGTLKSCCRAAGFEVAAFLRYAGGLEDALVAVLRPAAPARPVLDGPDLFTPFREGFARAGETIRANVASLSGGRPEAAALFGIGHQALVFANAFGLTGAIGTVTDDHPDKLGQVPPGFPTPITGSSALLGDEAIRLCLLAVAPRAEPRVRALLEPLVSRGVAFRSIFAGVPGSIDPE